MSPETHCPVTSVAFEIDTNSEEAALYDWVPIKSKDTNDSRGLYVSKKVMQHGIEKIKVSPLVPCMDEN